MSIYLFQEGFQKADYGKGSAISIVMLVIVALAQLLLRAEDGAGG